MGGELVKTFSPRVCPCLAACGDEARSPVQARKMTISQHTTSSKAPASTFHASLLLPEGKGKKSNLPAACPALTRSTGPPPLRLPHFILPQILNGLGGLHIGQSFREAPLSTLPQLLAGTTLLLAVFPGHRSTKDRIAPGQEQRGTQNPNHQHKNEFAFSVHGSLC